MKFLKEIWNRLWMESPSFFKIIQYISLATAAIAGLPELLSQFQSQMGIVLPSWLTNFSNKVVLISACVAWLIAKLPVSNPDAVKIKSDSTVVQKLPFTKENNS